MSIAPAIRLRKAIAAALAQIAANRRPLENAEISVEFYHLRGLVQAYGLMRFNAAAVQARFPKVALRLLHLHLTQSSDIVNKIDFLFLEDMRHVAESSSIHASRN